MVNEIISQAAAEMQIRYEPLADKYIARVCGREREFDDIETAVAWCCKVRDQGGRP